MRDGEVTVEGGMVISGGVLRRENNNSLFALEFEERVKTFDVLVINLPRVKLDQL